MEAMSEPQTESAAGRSDSDDQLLEALDALVSAALENMRAWTEMMSRVEKVRELRRQGVPYAEMSLEDHPSPRIIDVLTANQERLSVAGARYRRASVRQLRDDGVSTAEIARRMGVTRQRVANILRADADAEDE
jgi:hypothetical protein